jgi:hypothetical protein
MTRYWAGAILVMFAALICFGQNVVPSSSPQNSEADSKSASSQAVPALLIPMRLSKAIDSKKAKAGDVIEGKTASAVRGGDGIVIPAYSRVMGRVTQASAISKGDAESSLAIVFDAIQLRTGKDLEIKGVLQAVAPEPVVDTGAAGSGTLAPQGLNGSAAPPVGAQTADVQSNLSSTKYGVGTVLSPQSKGVFGFPNLELRLDSTLASSGKEIKLDKGVQLVLKVQMK